MEQLTRKLTTSNPKALESIVASAAAIAAALRREIVEPSKEETAARRRTRPADAVVGGAQDASAGSAPLLGAPGVD